MMMDSNKVIIYGLFDPRNGDCFYIGKTVQDLNRRLKEHLIKRNNFYKDNKIYSILKCGLKPRIAELLTIDDYYDPILKANFWEYVERYFIKYAKEKLNQPLTNLSNGGDGIGAEFLKKNVSQYDLDGNFIKNYKSIRDAALENKISESNISTCCRGIRRIAGNYKWRYCY